MILVIYNIKYGDGAQIQEIKDNSEIMEAVIDYSRDTASDLEDIRFTISTVEYKPTFAWEQAK